MFAQVGAEALAIFAQVAEALAIVVILAGISEALVEFLVAPAWERYGLPPFWLRYIGAAASFALVFLSGQNLLGDYLPANLVVLGRVLTGLLAGRGSNWIHDYFSAQRARADQGGFMRALHDQSWRETHITKD